MTTETTKPTKQIVPETSLPIENLEIVSEISTTEASTQEQLLISSETYWNVLKKKLISVDGDLTDSYGLFREDNGYYMGAVKKRYTPLQNAELLSLLFNAAEEVGVNINRGGTLSGGKRVYFQIELNNEQIGGTSVKRFLTGLNSHDGQTPIGFGSTNICVVCRNTFFKALQEVKNIRHTPNSHKKLLVLVEDMKIALTKEELVIANFQEMSGIRIASSIDDDFLRQILGVTENTRSNNRVDLLRSAIPMETEIHGQTKWALFNAVTRFTNHMEKSKDLRRSIVEGSAFAINNRAYDLITAL